MAVSEATVDAKRGYPADMAHPQVDERLAALAKAAEECAAAREAVTEAQEKRDRLIAALYADGVWPSRIGEPIGMSASNVRRIAAEQARR